MRRFIATLTGVAAATLAAPALAAPASANTQAKPAGPLAALTQQLVKGHGVKVSSRFVDSADGRQILGWSEAGTVEVSPSGLTASDITSKFTRYWDPEHAREMMKPARDIAFWKESYGSGPYYQPSLPEGKSWIRFTGRHAIKPGPSTLVDIFDRPLYKALLATTSVKKPGGKVGGTATTLYEGTISYGTVYKLSQKLHQVPGWEPDRSLAKVKVHWKLWLGGDLLARRLVTSYEQELAKITVWKRVIDTTYSSWGTKVSITPPPAGTVVDEDDLGTEIPDSRELTTVVPSATSPGWTAGEGVYRG
ncbi:hypothetical protein [Sphaerisporangium fuscum]|uniref:hypothetical protein n=1 Tax=Sphaerisporangium fuscum TaxID=2835868 RepID=UPI001BDC824B|nr:hypothetical protein [Sphaerisporangium fuscum]